MPDIEALDNDVDELDRGDGSALGLDVPEADAAEQARDLETSPMAPSPPRIRDGVPEADALDQSYPVALDEDDYR